MNENLAVNYLLAGRWTRNFCMPRYTPRGWWECDLFEMTPARAFREYEVKLSVADFRRDRGKEREIYRTWAERDQPRKFLNKHSLIAAADPRAPSQFYYVTQEGLLDSETLPTWAGWIELYQSEGAGKNAQYFERVRVKAPKIHGHKMAEDPEMFMGTAYYRMHRWGRGLQQACDETLVQI